MPSRKAECRRIGANVRTRATNVTLRFDCERRYGPNFKVATMIVVVVEAVAPPIGSGKKTLLRAV